MAKTRRISSDPSLLNRPSNHQMKTTANSIFDQHYRIVAVQSDRLLVRGVVSGEVLAILNPEPEVPLSQENFPLGKLIALTDPSTLPLN
jgi:hypothetical protein